MIRLQNNGPDDFAGWVRTTTDYPLAHDGPCTVGGDLIVPGPPIGDGNARILDIRAGNLAAGSLIEIDLAKAEPAKFVLAPVPLDRILNEVGILRVESTRQQLSVASVAPSGAAYVVHLRLRVGGFSSEHHDVWLDVYPDDLRIIRGVLVTTASNVSAADLQEHVESDFRLSLTEGDGSYTVTPDGGTWDVAGRTLADGQAWTETFVIHRRGATPCEILHSGLTDPWPEGHPLVTEPPQTWVARHALKLGRALAGWGESPIGVPPWSGRTGAQEDQVFPGAEVTDPVAAHMCVLAAQNQSKRPCHHLEADGSILDPRKHPGLTFWSCRPHVYGDQLNKPRQLTRADANDWSGWDEEHALINRLALGYRLTGRPDLQWQLRHHANAYLLHVNRVGAARAEGWLCQLAVRLYQFLDDRQIAEAVADRCRQRLDLAVAKWGTLRGLWDVRRDVPSLGPGLQWFTYQHAIATYGLDRAGEVFGHAEARKLALEGAQRLLQDGWAWHPETNRWRGHYTRPVLEGGRLGEPTWGSGVEVWHTLGVATVLRHHPDAEPARSIWNQLVRERREGGRWLPPEVLRG